ncbi:MAG: hypothetical protein Q4E56_05060 [Pseudomonadota bacterium]|nr:hypothetical protein [Pseudomonadota bacterium]
MLRKFTFQFFAAEGGTGSMTAPAQPNTSSPVTAPAGPTNQPGPEGASGAPAAAQTAPVAQVQQEESFESLIKGRYKADYDRRVKKAVMERFKSINSKFSPILDVLGQQYGIDVSDPDKVDYDALTRRLTDDKRLYEAEALEKGIPLDTLMQMKRMERQNAALQRENAMAQGEMQRREEFDRIVRQFAEVQAIYPGADLSQELANPDFGRLVSNGVPARTAYEVLHKAEIDAAKTRAVAQAAQQQAVAGIQANGMRPPEGAANAGNGVPVQFDPRKLTKQQRDEIRARVNRGEKITF